LGRLEAGRGRAGQAVLLLEARLGAAAAALDRAAAEADRQQRALAPLIAAVDAAAAAAVARLAAALNAAVAGAGSAWRVAVRTAPSPRAGGARGVVTGGDGASGPAEGGTIVGWGRVTSAGASDAAPPGESEGPAAACAGERAARVGVSGDGSSERAARREAAAAPDREARSLLAATAAEDPAAPGIAAAPAAAGPTVAAGPAWAAGGGGDGPDDGAAAVGAREAVAERGGGDAAATAAGAGPVSGKPP
jgi:hypothetical protein